MHFFGGSAQPTIHSTPTLVLPIRCFWNLKNPNLIESVIHEPQYIYIYISCVLGNWYQVSHSFLIILISSLIDHTACTVYTPRTISSSQVHFLVVFSPPRKTQSKSGQFWAGLGQVIVFYIFTYFYHLLVVMLAFCAVTFKMFYMYCVKIWKCRASLQITSRNSASIELKK